MLSKTRATPGISLHKVFQLSKMMLLSPSRKAVWLSYLAFVFVYSNDLCHSLADPLCHGLAMFDAETMRNLILIDIHCGLPVLLEVRDRSLAGSVASGCNQIIPSAVGNP